MLCRPSHKSSTMAAAASSRPPQCESPIVRIGGHTLLYVTTHQNEKRMVAMQQQSRHAALFRWWTDHAVTFSSREAPNAIHRMVLLLGGKCSCGEPTSTIERSDHPCMCTASTADRNSSNIHPCW
ncbi:hypothetical protein F441_20128 [Phytophthora nicotianae CJ01A1]|uniref:Uncharacterized protein n=4 Tax=Phytophthora nicotianae TaxID=4792 RepID=V9E1Q6_PHYNI|nr:hypothetical protein F443_20237 [Phytophthora nicotianae P1569]ETM33293.1 hypothetical protein L914_19454 [Phytophthora nicotianae]ETO61788.1 hypothetical protein F444_20253 [Phytophthora nicotianae P1976]ETP02853.1 hypothetical protein F441_20128 [Phytophthora nicotianae CJ01A1]